MSRQAENLGHLPQQPPHSPWTKGEKRFLRENVQMGVAWLHSQMPWRSFKAIRRMSERLNLSWKEPGRLDDMCPQCHENRIQRGSYAARFGICNVCYQKERERKFNQMHEEEQAKARAEAARQRYYRGRRA